MYSLLPNKNVFCHSCNNLPRLMGAIRGHSSPPEDSLDVDTVQETCGWLKMEIATSIPAIIPKPAYPFSVLWIAPISRNSFSPNHDFLCFRLLLLSQINIPSSLLGTSVLASWSTEICLMYSFCASVAITFSELEFRSSGLHSLREPSTNLNIMCVCSKTFLKLAPSCRQ